MAVNDLIILYVTGILSLSILCGEHLAIRWCHNSSSFKGYCKIIFQHCLAVLIEINQIVFPMAK